MKESILRDKSFKFAVRIVNLSIVLKSTKKEYVISKQILRSGTSIGAQIREAQYAISTKDFLHKLSIAQKECNETLYWLELLFETKFLTQKEFNSIYTEAEELIKIITSSIKTMKTKQTNK